MYGSGNKGVQKRFLHGAIVGTVLIIAACAFHLSPFVFACAAVALMGCVVGGKSKSSDLFGTVPDVTKSNAKPAASSPVAEDKNILFLMGKFERIIEKYRGQISAIQLLKKAKENIVDEELDDPSRASMINHLEALVSIVTTNVADGRYGEKEFPTDNLAYKALVGVVRKWSKYDAHYHLSNSLRADFISKLFTRNLKYATQMRDEAVKEVRKCAFKTRGEKNFDRAQSLDQLACQWEEDLEVFIAVFRRSEAPL